MRGAGDCACEGEWGEKMHEHFYREADRLSLPNFISYQLLILFS